MPNNLPGLPGPMELRTFRQTIGGKMSWFWYNTANQAIGIGAPPAEPQIVIDSQSDFLMLELMAFSDQDGAGNFYTIEFSPSSSGRGFQSNPSHSQCIAGTGQRPHYMPVPILFEAASSIALRITALNAAVAYNIRLSFGGAKLFR